MGCRRRLGRRLHRALAEGEAPRFQLFEGRTTTRWEIVVEGIASPLSWSATSPRSRLRVQAAVLGRSALGAASAPEDIDMPRIGSRGRAKRQGGANAPRAVEHRAVDGHFRERHPARLRVMEAGSRGRAPEGPPPFTTPDVKPVFQSSAGPRPDEANAVVVHVLDGDKRYHQMQRRWVSLSKRRLVFEKEEAVRDREISVLPCTGRACRLEAFPPG